jgi:Uncharacterized protein potentially involved in peptidoglycan biosynthesis
MTLIDEKYALLGGAQSFLGQPTTVELPTPNGLGSYRHYQGGSIYWNHVYGAAFEVHGLIRDKWAALGWENSGLGFPTSDERPVGGGRGRANEFERGAISWSPTTNAHYVHGDIYARWVSAGINREDGFGFPLSDPLTTSDGRAQYIHFENGTIYRTSMGTYEISGTIKNAWAGAGWEQGPLGYPVSSPNQMRPSMVPSLFQDFEHGTMYSWLDSTRTVLRQTSTTFVSGIMIDWNNLGSLLPDNDRISASFSGHDPNGPILLTLNAGAGITWWKAVTLWSASQGDIPPEAWIQDRVTSNMIAIAPSAVEPGDRYLLLKKAKAFNIHTGMYWLGPAHRMLGNDVTLTWLQDWG